MTTYAYDAMDRITEACFASSCTLPVDPFVRWTYDDVGNRLQEQRPTGTTVYAYDTADRLTSATSLTRATAYTYDANGNRSTAGAWTYGYDIANRMTSADDGSTSIAYAYDGDGMRTAATSTTSEGTSTLATLWDPNRPVPQIADERDGADAVLRRYTYGADRSAMVDAQGSHFYLQDALGSVVGLASPAGAVEASYAYEPFGAQRATSVGAATGIVNLMRFTGERVDEQTDLYHLRARQYDAVSGTFLQTDPVQPTIDDPYVAAYVYANNRPTVLVDPLGLFGWGRLFRGVASIAVGVAFAAGVAPGAVTLGVVAAGGLIGIGIDTAISDGLIVYRTCGSEFISSTCAASLGWFGFDVVSLAVAVTAPARWKTLFGGPSTVAGFVRK